MEASPDKRGAEAFERYYSQLFGARWAALRASMLAPEQSQYALTTHADRPYYIDRASVFVAQAAVSGAARTILDLCAAPGGKTLVLALACANDCTIVANERSAARRERLRRVLGEHLGPELGGRVTVTGHDARRWGLYEQSAYDLVLADVPCSSEAHLLSGKGKLHEWSPSRIDRLSREQFAILRAASQAVRPGGTVVYATCSLPRAENEELVQRAVERSRKKGPLLSIADAGCHDKGRIAGRLGLQLSRSDPGWRIWPDENSGAGPMYFCMLERQTTKSE